MQEVFKLTIGRGIRILTLVLLFVSVTVVVPAAHAQSNQTMLATSANGDDDDNGYEDDDDDNGYEDDDDYYGIIDSRPSGTAGEWVISGRSFTATDDTELDTDDGPLVVGACVSVDYEGSIAEEMDSEDRYECSTGDTQNTAYGIVETIPTDPQNGTWTISSVAYRATDESDIDDNDDDDLVVGACVEVEYYTRSGTNFIIELDDEDDRACSGTPSMPRTGLLYGEIDDLPDNASLLGTWEIDDLDVEATEGTIFADPLNMFAEDVCVRAWFTVLPGGERTLTKVQQIAAAFCDDDDDDVGDVYGVIDALPDSFPTNRTGTWIISGIAYLVTDDTDLDQEYGIFAVGAFVEVEYELINGERVASDIDTHVAPGKGRSSDEGILIIRPDDDLGSWQIDDDDYESDPAIDVDLDDDDDLRLAATGTRVTVSYHTAPDGTRFATSVRTATSRTIYLPIVQR